MIPILQLGKLRLGGWVPGPGSQDLAVTKFQSLGLQSEKKNSFPASHFAELEEALDQERQGLLLYLLPARSCSEAETDVYCLFGEKVSIGKFTHLQVPICSTAVFLSHVFSSPAEMTSVSTMSIHIVVFFPHAILDSHFSYGSALAPSFPTRVWEAFPGSPFLQNKSQEGQRDQKRSFKKRSWSYFMASAVITIFFLSLLLSKPLSGSCNIPLGFYITKASTSGAWTKITFHL